MTLRIACGLILIALVACGGRDRDGDANAQAGSGPGLTASGSGGGTPRAGSGGRDSAVGSSGSGSGQAGSSAGSAGAGGSSALTCKEREAMASRAVSDALRAADLSCEVDEDCERISIDTRCHAACGGLVGPEGKTSVQAVIADQNAGICATFERDGCRVIIPPCVPPQPIACIAGVCSEDDGTQPEPDAGTPDSGTPPEPGCLSAAIGWGLDGGFVAYRDQFALEPCAEFSAERMPGRSPGDPEACANEVVADADITIGDVNAALAHPDVTAGFAAAPVLYGRDTRPVDGTVFRIERGGKVIELGQDCGGGGSAGCRSIPAGLAALRQLLQSLAQQQVALDGCEALRP